MPKPIVVTGMLCLLMGANACAGEAASGAPDDALLIKDVTLISPERDAPLTHADVLIRDGRIARIGTKLVSGGVQSIDGTGRFLIPGLIDSHVHVNHLVGMDDDVVEKHPELLAAYREQLPRAYLAYGFTTLVDLDLVPGSLDWFDAQPVRPRLYNCGPGVRIPAGYMTQRITRDAQLKRIPNLVYEPTQSQQWPVMLDPRDYTPENAVERAVATHAICLKVFYESGFGGVFNWPVPRAATLSALHRAAKTRHLPMVMHANAVDAWQAAVEEHTEIIAHGLWQWPGDRSISTPPPAARQVIQKAARLGMYVQPTMRAIYGEKTIFDASIIDDPRFALSMPRNLVTYLHSDEAKAAWQANKDSYVKMFANASDLIDVAATRATETLKLMNSEGVPLILGTDTPSDEGIGNPPGLNAQLELQHWADAGIPLPRILRAATLDNATALGLANELGSIEVGKRADLVLLRSDPLKSVNAYDSIEIVIANGRRIRRDLLKPMH